MRGHGKKHEIEPARGDSQAAVPPFSGERKKRLMGNIILLLVIVGRALLVMAAVTTLAGRDSLNGIKSRTVGDGQHGTARWATVREVKITYAHVPFQTAAWRSGKDRPTAQGLILGSVGTGKKLTAWWFLLSNACS